MEENKYISIKGARVNNLKNVSVDIPRNKLAYRALASLRWHSTPSMQKGNAAMWKASAVMLASFWVG